MTHISRQILRAALGAALTVLLTPTLAQADVEFDPQVLGNFDLPEGMTSDSATIQSTRDGKMVVFGTTGMTQDPATSDPACTVVLVEDSAATSYEYQFQGAATVCVGVTAHPDGGFFVRGTDPTADEGAVVGFTAHIDAQGNEVWAIPDQDLVDAKETSEPGGTGRFKGVYQQPHPEMAFSAEHNRLMAFTVAKLNIGSSGVQMTQAHLVNAETGRLKVTGQTFGSDGGFGYIAETITRASDGDFVLYIYSAGSQGAYFFSYDGRINLDAFEPLGEDWSQRYVRQMIYGPNGNLYLIWTPTNEPDAPTEIAAVDDQAAEVWSTSYEATALVADKPTGEDQLVLGPPRAMWVSSTYILVLYQAASQLYLRVIDATDGQDFGVAPLAGLTEHEPRAIVNGSAGSLELVAVEEGGTTLHEIALNVSGTPGANAGADAGLDAGSADGGAGYGGDGSGDTLCTLAAVPEHLPARPAAAASALLLLALAWRRQRH